ncbi:hypothetical protein DICSQDRAFT_134945 [Dichomitus squalens LYAD-421 SS1]|uniref:RING-type E3 ubiquitin transferase n=1 Tax=Dichomitus squalens TaxID=114155 RepID=A0A4Q9Q6H8_9APHY|nr:uncharacterized protein DICSQDRAFT_134945 [Dichomitus squalens LYAD-421 SS1]EJF63506.1 hypothetical protein DICSQDRAFT_134945 [Dichomitus squalens LYAD-421 SS1]TBU62214.1 hypothetical protein BD310DRAFT_811310 [Dichomitus squalens]
MISLFLALVLTSSSLVAPARCTPVDWLRKLTGPPPGSARDDSSWLWGWAWASDGTVSVVDRTPPVTFPARPASFGAELADPLLGYVIPLSSFTSPCPQDGGDETNRTRFFEADPVLGCPELCISGDHTPEDADTWIALVQRGGCPFVEKARQAQKLGAKAVVVGGDRDNPDALLNMFSERDSSDVTIAATYIKYWDYVQLSAMIATSNTTHNGLKTLSLLISTEYSAWEWYSPVITFIIILLLPSLLTFLTLLIHRVRAARAAQRDRAPEDIVHKFPSRVWTGTGWEKHEPLYVPADVSNAEGPPDLERGPDAPSTSHEPSTPAWADQQVECAICLEMFVKGDRVRVLPCYHLFHIDEIDEWLIHKKKLCPICKADVTQPHSEAQPPAPSDSDDHHDRPTSTRAASSSAHPDERTPLLQPPSDQRAGSPSST